MPKALKKLRLLMCSSLLFVSLSVMGQSSEDPHFDGFYLGVDGGSQYFISGALINDVDILAQESKFVLEFTLGARKQLLNDKLVLGIAGHYGISDGDMTLTDPAEQLAIFYKNQNQNGFGIHAGYVLGKKKNFMVYGFVRTVSRTFDLDIMDQLLIFSQVDKETWPKIGLGFEAVLNNKVHANLNIGSMRVNLDDKIKNEPVANKLDISVGLIYQM